MFKAFKVSKVTFPHRRICPYLFFSFSDGKYDEALSLYTKAIDLNPQVPAYYGNRSFCYIKTEYFGSALEDANKAIDLDKKYIKVKILKKRRK